MLNFNRFEIKVLKAKSQKAQFGFTLVELLVVLFIMAVIAGAIIANYNGSRPNRNLHIALNELVTNIRKAQGYSLTSQATAQGASVQFYVVRFETAKPNQYIIESVYNTKTPPAQVRDIETVYLPSGVSLASINVDSQSVNCLLLAFKAPFAQTLTNAKATACSGGAGSVSSGDDYDNIINYAVNVSGSTVQANTFSVIQLQSAGIAPQQVMVNGVVGLVCPTAWTTGSIGSPTCLTSY